MSKLSKEQKALLDQYSKSLNTQYISKQERVIEHTQAKVRLALLDRKALKRLIQARIAEIYRKDSLLTEEQKRELPWY